MLPSTVTLPWAKLQKGQNGAITAALPLIEHVFDVGAAMAALLAGGAWAHALEQAAGRPLSEQDVVRLTVLAALHDIGKANWGFQARWDRKADRIGHEPQVIALFGDPQISQTPAARAFRALLGDWGALSYLPALMAHHGRPRAEFARPQAGKKPWEAHARYWRPANGYDPTAEVARILEAAQARWPRAWQPGEKLPDAPRFVALFAGLVVLADWLSSDTKRFPVAGPYGDAREPLRLERAPQVVRAEGLASLTTPEATFESAFGFPPHGVQSQANADDLGPVALIEAETGSGKTEAALWRWLDLRRRGLVDGLYFALPTRSAAVQLQGRVDAMLQSVWGEGAPQAVLAIPGYLRVGDAAGQALPGYEVAWDDGPVDGRWAAEHSKRFLAARVAVGTIDQALLGALRVRHAPVRATALARNLLVVDEVHASDAYMGGLLERLLDNHVRAGGHALLLSATLGAAARACYLKQSVLPLAEAVAQPYPALSGSAAPLRPASAAGPQAKRMRIEVAGLIDDPEAIAAQAVEAARAGASVLVVRNSVRGAVAVAQAVEALAPALAFRVGEVATLHHGRFAPDDRRLLDEAVQAAFGKGRTAEGRVLVGTQTLEQSLDIDADLLITDLAPMDVLLQRIGRLHRHPRCDRGAFTEARAIVLRAAERDLTPLLGGARHGLGPGKEGRGAYPNLLQLEATLRLLETDPTIAIPADNRRLVEHALHPEVQEALADELGAAWRNHASDCNGIAYADRGSANDLSLDLGMAFRDLVFPDGAEHVATRLGAQDLLVACDPPLDGPFGKPVARLSFPAWLAGTLPLDAKPEPLGRDEDGQLFRLGERRYVYGRWGLSEAR